MLKNLLVTFLRFACYDFKKNLLTLTDLFTLKASSVKLVFYFIFLFYPFTQLSEELFFLMMYLFSGRRQLQLPRWIVLCPDQAFHHERTKSLRQTVHAGRDEDWRRDSQQGSWSNLQKQSIIPWITSVTRPSKKLTKKEQITLSTQFTTPESVIGNNGRQLLKMPLPNRTKPMGLHRV